MASSSINADTLITIKINFDGASRRFKLPLRDLGINVLESKLRALLGVSLETDAVFERYSDSAGAYVVLDKSNIGVYKQLNRAAKAKQKLKLRVTVNRPVEIREEEAAEKRGPRPASVEDDVEEPSMRSVTEVTEEATPVPENPVVSPSPSPVLQDATPTEEQSEAQRRSQALASMESTLEAIQATMAAAAAKNPLGQNCSGTVAPTVVLPASTPLLSCKSARTNYAVCCNSCDRTTLDPHYHCSICDDGDFDLCQDCVDQGITCYGADHWMIKRFVKGGVIINSTTERIAPKPKQPSPKSPSTEAKAPAVSVVAPAPAPAPTPAAAPCALPPVAPVVLQERIIPIFHDFLYSSIRTCNCCVQELPEVEFVHCTTCEDFDLCRACFAKNRHGHHPKHGFVPAVEGTRLEPEVSRRLEPGRDQLHNAICDGCDDDIKGVRNKCLDCPDWDYCSSCVMNAPFIHPGHRFVAVYEPLEPRSSTRMRAFGRSTHVGICCDGPLCRGDRGVSSYIIGDRYKCAVCDDTDFCANCEASPANNHNKTHPLIKFRTPVRNVSVTTTGEHENGRAMPAMGDRTRSGASETSSEGVLFSNIQTVVDVKPALPVKVEEKEVKEEVEEKPLPIEKAPVSEELVAVFVRDTVTDGSRFGPDHVFEQTWVLRNDGTTSWPAGCAVRYVGGDYMGHVDQSHPAATQDLESSSESTICYAPVAPGEEFPFSVLLRTPQRTGRIVSNWRLTTKDGIKFGSRLWCDVEVENPPQTPAVNEQAAKTEPEAKSEEVATQQSQMIFPKLEKESPVASIHEEAKSDVAASHEEDFEDCADVDEWAEEDDSEDGFMTDEEYDILDASDEEYREGQLPKK